jgi:capsular polysaccharide biosynthesis protein
MAKLFSPIPVIGETPSPVSVAPARGAEFRKLVRRHKWRLRPLKKLVLPLRHGKRQAVNLIRAVTPGMTQSPRIEPSTRAYAERTASASVKEIFPAELLKQSPDPLLSGAQQPRAKFSDPAFVYELRDVDFWGYYGGSIITDDNVLLGDLSPEVWGVENHPIFSRLHLPEARILHGRTGIAVTAEAPGNYYHWFIDLLPRLALLQAAGGWDSYDRFLINGSGAHYERASLIALGIPLEKIIYVGENDRFKIETAIVPSKDDSSKAIAPWKVQILRQLRDALPDAKTDNHRRIYISRKRVGVRHVSNEDELTPLLREKGFTVVEPENLPWNEQVQLFANAEVVLTPHGAALANAAFCRPGTFIAEIAARETVKCYLRLAAAGDLRYQFIEAIPIVSSNRATRARENENMSVDVAQIRELLREL